VSSANFYMQPEVPHKPWFMREPVVTAVLLFGFLAMPFNLCVMGAWLVLLVAIRILEFFGTNTVSVAIVSLPFAVFFMAGYCLWRFRLKFGDL
jgi:hypothetical protein